MAQLRHVPLLRLLHRLLPLQHRWLWLVNRQLGRDSEATVPWGPYSMTFATTWREPSAVINPVFLGPAMNPELALVRRLASDRPVGAWVDVGANIGCYVLALRQLTRSRIIAYEPLPQLFGLLEKNVAKNRLPDVILRNKACGEKGGSALMVPGANAAIATGDVAGQRAVGGDTEAVEIVCLDDDLRGERIGFLKIDVEGFEVSVLRGARGILAEHRPHLFIEVHPHLLRRYGTGAAELIGLLTDHYDITCWDYGSESGQTRLSRVLGRYFPGRARRFSSIGEFISACEQGHSSPQLFLCGRPRTVAGGQAQDAGGPV